MPHGVLGKKWDSKKNFWRTRLCFLVSVFVCLIIKYFNFVLRKRRAMNMTWKEEKKKQGETRSCTLTRNDLSWLVMTLQRPTSYLWVICKSHWLKFIARRSLLKLNTGLKQLTRTIKQLYPFKHKTQIEIELQCSFKARNAMDTG